ncbi:hypothetical protein SELMODRAFT_37774, partial [Selaginella moellendorffii]
GIQPSEVTFTGILSGATACQLGRSRFVDMVGDYHVAPSTVHYGSMVDALGRAGQVEYAARLVEEMPVPPDAAAWGAVLSACKTQRDVSRAAWAAVRAFDVDPANDTPYMLLSNAYVS